MVNGLYMYLTCVTSLISDMIVLYQLARTHHHNVLHFLVYNMYHSQMLVQAISNRHYVCVPGMSILIEPLYTLTID